MGIISWGKLFLGPKAFYGIDKRASAGRLLSVLFLQPGDGGAAGLGWLRL